MLFMQLTSAVLLISDALAWAFRGGTGVTGYLMVRISISMILMFVTDLTTFFI